MNISIFGLGYVGTVSMACLAEMGHKIIGVDKSRKKVELINKGISPILEPGLDKLISKGFRRKLISATFDYTEAVIKSDITFVCIGTPGSKQGSLNLASLFNALKEISKGLKEKKDFHAIVIRSTLLPGSFKEITTLIEKYSCKKNSSDFCVAINPEFLREGTAVSDFFNPPFTIIGSGCGKTAGILKKVYKGIKSDLKIVDENAAEVIKLACNAFHAMKISFANEVGSLCREIGIDSNLLMKIFCDDKKLNISESYLKPGFAYGGSCLPKDVSALCKLAEKKKTEIPLISNTEISNRVHLKRAIKMIEGFGQKKIGFWGLSFKNNTDDMRGSPVIEIINHFLKKNYRIRAFDQNVIIKKLTGSNKEYIEKNFPGMNRVKVNDFDVLLKHSKLVVVNSFDDDLIKKIKKHKDIIIFDIINVHELRDMKNYHGLCW